MTSCKDNKSHKPGKSYLPPRPQIDHSSSKLKVNTTSYPSSPTNYTCQSQSTSAQAPSTQRHTRQCPRVQVNSPVHLLRGIDRVRLPSRVGVFEGGWRRRKRRGR
ncbi:hypothetical protein K443DRAFT_674780 [Laccaria amethystina LaAM-08-1]|uniref:Uncharacterized protein n=1 Tax=Laccaria amethystina LaAM-08-1 TaxID=1095629 RepID=A0A0C9XWM0_9AGAR|nr:hypothetical protein K443DRAFT_674780 [Laccaria amethystina LaAM-08-1]